MTSGENDRYLLTVLVYALNFTYEIGRILPSLTHDLRVLLKECSKNHV